MAHNEPWQVFHHNGRPIAGLGKTRSEFTDEFIMGAAHVWIWRRNRSNSSVEILLQKRALDKPSWPGYKDISTAGHIDLDEDPVSSSIREALEEINLAIEPDDLRYIFSLRTPLVPNEIDHVYLYEVNATQTFSFDDGEVDSVEWVAFETFYELVKDPDGHMLVNQGSAYFVMLCDYLRRL